MKKLINGLVWSLLFVVITMCTVQLLQGIPVSSLSLQPAAVINTIAFYLASNYQLYGMPVGLLAALVFFFPALLAFWAGYRLAGNSPR